MSTLATLLVKLGIDTTDYDTGLDDAEEKAGTSASGIGSKLSGMGSILMGAGTKMTAFATAPILASFGLAVDAASDMNETVSKSNVVFGGSAALVQQFATSAAQNIGLTNQAALEAASTYGNLFVSMGIGQDTASNWSTNLVQLAGDLASFNNLDPTDVLQKLQSGMVGETEPLRALGVNMNEASVKAMAMQMGLIKAGDEMTIQQAMAARYALIMGQTKTAQGDFARTSDGLANSTRIVHAKMGDLAAIMGTQLLPIAIKLMEGVGQLVSWFTNLDPTAQKVILTVLGLVAAVGPLLIVVGGMVSGFAAILPIIGPVIAILTGPLGLAIAGIILAIALLALAWKNDWGGIREKFAVVKDWLIEAFGKIYEWFTVKLPEGINIVKDWINEHLIKPFNNVRDAIQEVIDKIIGFVMKAADLLGIKIPDWMLGHSPSPFETSLRGIGEAMDKLSEKQIPAFRAGLLTPAFTTVLAGGGGISADFTINAAPGQSEDLIARRVLARLAEARRFTRAGGGFAGG